MFLEVAIEVLQWEVPLDGGRMAASTKEMCQFVVPALSLTWYSLSEPVSKGSLTHCHKSKAKE